jgi:ParB/RepB/Spo0J family partition protein
MAKLVSDASSVFEDTPEEDGIANDIVGPSYRAVATVSKYPVRSVLLSDIIQDSDVQFREQPFDPEHNEKDASLLATMGDPNVGLLQPIMVQEVAGIGTNAGLFGQGKKYKVVFGHNRRDAAKMLGWEKINAHVAKADEDVSHFTFIENDSSKPQSVYERAMTLRKYFKLHPSLTQVELAERVGLTRSMVVKFLQITEAEIPKPLVFLFARGLSINAAVALKPVFMAVESSSHPRLSELLDGITERKALQLSREVVEKMIGPFEAIEMFGIASNKAVTGEAVSSHLIASATSSHVQSTTDVVEITQPTLTNHSSKQSIFTTIRPSAPEPSLSVKNASRLPTGVAADHDGVVTKLAIDNGTSKFLVKKLIVKARAENLSYEELDDACLISARCQNADQAVVHLLTIMADARAFSAFRQYARSVRLALRAMAVREKDHDFAVATALRESIIVPLALVPESPQKKK